ncbi:hypothetical protein SPRG_11320 [Saprolegnia parasitica CBS 223.65]|uniref:Uncharacterized protein n=1 Tax=Saprolegnia parasitica (strain CBS 223.65) TaxID=695850 RepID=A0A067BVR5_SAPPC|nr:hypothetical protein SPRG_11320 [Saprolegnia parasitica CBS 223.65]KDO22368.1 hypothetical protein SPRG_11320 [Saprolegnia parasitica CBS 223.65]|eukprot:XP_012206892.1 hypothetical protein SPRG_11320 [Saprolegnia parasitica CBS 223.65]
MSDELPTKTKKTFRFSVASDVDLLKEVINVAPYDAPFGQTIARWEEVTEHMRGIHGEHVTFTGCRKRFDDLMAAFKKDALKAMRASGTAAEVCERDLLLEDISDLMDAVADKKKAAKEDKGKKVDTSENDGHRIRAAALQGLKRKTAGGDDDQESDHEDHDETPSKRSKRAAAATNDVASVVKDFLSMIASTNQLKHEEVAAKREEIAAKRAEVAVRKEELALRHRKLELEEQRYLLDKAEREARFQMEKTEREAQLQFMRSTIEMMRSLTSNK